MKVTALPIGLGDAFLLEHNGENILIDGGVRHSSVTRDLRAHLGVAVGGPVHLHKVVCTHADNDHAGGLIDVLEDPAIDVEELWLPATWFLRLPDLMSNFDGFVIELLSDLLETDDAGLQDGQRDDEKEEPQCAPDLKAAAAGRVSGEEVGVEDALDIIRQSPRRHKHKPRDKDEYKLWQDFRLIVKRQSSIDSGPRLEIVLSGDGSLPLLRHYHHMCQAARRIHDLVDAAIRKRVPRVRWFDYEIWERTGVAAGGNPGLLRPLNSQEVRRLIYKPSLSAGSYLYLSLENREALTFIADQGANRAGPAAIFSSDWGTVAPLLQDSFLAAIATSCDPGCSLLVTTPHHGSKDTWNAAMYGVIDGWHGAGDEIAWLRSDTNSTRRPCDEYLARAQRRCTHCKGLGLRPAQAVTVAAAPPAWAYGPCNACPNDPAPCR